MDVKEEIDELKVRLKKLEALVAPTTMVSKRTGMAADSRRVVTDCNGNDHVVTVGGNNGGY